MEIKEKGLFDFEDKFLMMEEILVNYLEIEPGLIYIKGKRYPLIDRIHLEKFIEKGNASHEPFMTVHAPKLLRDYVYMRMIQDNPFSNLLLDNPIAKEENIKRFYPSYLYDLSNLEELVYMTCGDMSIKEFELLKMNIDYCYNEVKKFISPDPEYVYSIDIESYFFNLLKLVDIRAFRLEEALSFNKITCEDEECVNENPCCENINEIIRLEDKQKYDREMRIYRKLKGDKSGSR